MSAAPGSRHEAAAGWLLSLPALLGLVLFVLAPFVFATAVSFTGLRLGSPLPVHFVGLRAYERLFSDPVFLRAFANNALFALVVVPVQTAAALALALLLERPSRLRALYRALFFMPVVFPLSLVSVVWVLLYAPGPDGMINAALHWLSFGHWRPHDFLHDPHLALAALMLTSIWQGLGFQMVVLLAGLQAVPAERYEAARVDGAGAWRRFLHVTLPGLRNPLLFVVLVTSVLAFRVFDQVRIMTHGGPDYATTTLIYQAVQAAFDRGNVARSAAISVVFFVTVLGVALAQRRLLRERREVV